MNYLIIKKKLEKILPKKLFNISIFLWRKTAIPFQNWLYNQKKSRFKEKQFKKIFVANQEFYLQIDPKNGYIDEQFFLYGIYEKEIFELISREVKAGETFVDIGANIGMYTNFTPKIVGENGKIIAFEPITKIFQQNKESNEKNNYKNVFLHNFALSNSETETKIYLNETNIWGSSLNPKENHKTEKIITKIGDNFLLNEKNIDFIKIDTEGFEWFVLLGIKKTIEKFRPKIIIEFSPKLFQNSDEWEKILNFLKKFYKNIYIIEIQKHLDLTNKNDEKTYYNLLNEEQINLFCTP